MRQTCPSQRSRLCVSMVACVAGGILDFGFWQRSRHSDLAPAPASYAGYQHGKRAWHPCLGQDVLVGDPILPGDAQESSEASIEPTFLTGVEGPCFASIEKSTQHTLLVHFHLYVSRQQDVAPNSYCNASHSCCCLANAHVQLGIQREVADDIRAQVGEVVDNLKGVVADGDLRSAVDVLAHNVGLLEADGEAKLSAGVSEAGDKSL